MRLRAILPLILLLAGGTPVAADENDAALAKEKQSLEAFAAQNKDCHEWSDGCMVCRRQTDSSFGCSLPGIACEPSGLACRATADHTHDPKPPELTPPK